ncbi:hypothetical protein [Streptomyces sp. H39-S7]|uniref:hypothetical protein n=1 Tax=Streptomyces sp. H39-S7 TaxID=3004357 RepID=UPI0022AE646A|nr:hypothetical protein [Streptomyces sp. H39-S7]MCZ4122284.1 hypothetical protein [Streptomyces sp. H39-S7]
MARIGVTGHRCIPADALDNVHAGIRAQLRGGGAGGFDAAFSSLAAGADQIFAEVALGCGVPVTAVIPGAADYGNRLGGMTAQVAYRRLLASCADRVELPAADTEEEAYLLAGRWIVDHVDRLVAVWDGCPARGLGGTGDVVEYARLSGVPVVVVWSPGVRRA